MAEPIELIAQAKTLDEVVAATGQYLTRWSPESLAQIPRRCRPHWIGSAEDIEMYAGQLQAESARARLRARPSPMSSNSCAISLPARPASSR